MKRIALIIKHFMKVVIVVLINSLDENMHKACLQYMIQLGILQQALKYQSVTDIVRSIRKIVHRGEKGIGHSV